VEVGLLQGRVGREGAGIIPESPDRPAVARIGCGILARLIP
jgi:hypothetical protein